jgi:phage shock protein A
MFKRLSNLIRGFLSLFISGLEKSNPEALLEAEKENLRKQIARYNQGLASHAGLCERLMAQVRQQEKEEKELAAKATAHLKAGNRDAAGQFALRLQTVRQQLAENRTQLAQAEETYQNLVKARDISIQEAQNKIRQLKHALNDLKIQQATAELAEMASGMISEIGGSGDTLSRLHEMVEEERTQAAGRARVARDSLSTTDVDLKEAEQKALADQALAEFAAEAGIVLEPTVAPAATETAPKTMGPRTGEQEPAGS